MVDISSIRTNSVTGQDISGKTGPTSPVVQTGALSMDLTEGSLMEMRLKYSLDKRQEVYHAFTRVDGGNDLDARQDKITDDELTELFGEHSSTVRSLLNSRTDVKLSDLSALRGKPEILDNTLSYLKQKPDTPFASLLSRDLDGSLNVNMTELDPKLKLKKLMEEDVKHEKLSDVSKLLNERKDFSFNDLVHKSADGKTTTTWSVSDGQSRQIMEHRRDVKPKELTSLFGTLVKAFDGNPAEAKKAYTQ